MPLGHPLNRDAEQHATEATGVALKARARSGTLAATAAGWVGQVVQLALYAALYRLLAPEVWGQYWTVLLWVLLLRTFSTAGLNIGAVQRAELSDGQSTTLFWLMLAAGTLTALATAAVGPLLAWYHAEPELLPLALAMSITALLAAAGAQHQALVERRMRLGALAAVRLGCQVAGGVVAVALAWTGWGVWSLVAQAYVELGLLAALVWWLEPWRPAWPSRGESVRDLIRFGGYYTTAMVLFAVAQLVDKLLLSFVIDGTDADRELGYYTQAFAWMMKPVLLVTTPVSAVALPALSRAAGTARAASTPPSANPERSADAPALYRDVLLAFSRLIAMVLFPCGVGLAIVAPEAMVVLGGARWAPAGEILRVLAIVILAQGFINIVGSILVSVGRADRLCRGALALAVLTTVGSAIGLAIGRWLNQPAQGLAAGYVVAVVGVFFVPYLIFALRTAGVRASDWFRTLRPAAVAAVAMGAVVLACRFALARIDGLAPAASLAIEIAIGVAAYALFARREAAWFRTQLGRLTSGA
jgi:PST family polysaccharide transporter